LPPGVYGDADVTAEEGMLVGVLADADGDAEGDADADGE